MHTEQIKSNINTSNSVKTQKPFNNFLLLIHFNRHFYLISFVNNTNPTAVRNVTHAYNHIFYNLCVHVMLALSLFSFVFTFFSSMICHLTKRKSRIFTAKNSAFPLNFPRKTNFLTLPRLS